MSIHYLNPSRVLEVLSIKFDKNLQDSRHLLDELKDKIKLLTATSDSVEIQVSKKRSKSKKSAQVSAGSKSFRDVLGDSITARKAHSSIENGNNSPLAVVQPDPVLFKPKKNAKWATAFNLPDETRSIMLSAEVYGWVPEREDCVKYFSRYGPVFGFYEPKGKKICFLKFQNYDSAATAIGELNQFPSVRT